jgi:hypothetical protein
MNRSRECVLPGYASFLELRGAAITITITIGASLA